MKRRVILLGSLGLGFVLAITCLVMANGPAGSKIIASFVNSEPAYSPFPSMVQSDRLAFDIWNGGSKSVFLAIDGIEDAHGNWMGTNYTLGQVPAGQSNQYYFYVAPRSEPRSLRIRVSKNASILYKARFAMRLLVQRAKGRYRGQQLWHDGLQSPVEEITLKLGKESNSSKRL
jgi:hypothetical protein